MSEENNSPQKDGLVDGVIKRALAPLGPKARQVAVYFFEHPDMKQKDIGDYFGMSRQRVSAILGSNRVLAVVADLLRHNVALDTPMAYQSFRECLKSKSDDVKLRASIRHLEENKVFGPQKKEITLKTEIENMSLDELSRAIRRAQQIPGPIIDGEIVEEKDDGK